MTLIIAGGLPASAQQGGTAINGSQPAPIDDTVEAGGAAEDPVRRPNWYLSDNVRLEMTYGYGALDRFDLRGQAHFFQTRLQLQR